MPQLRKFVEVHMEVTTFCNFQCPFCPLDQISRPSSFMPVDWARQAIGEVADHQLAPRVAYHLMGESLMHPEIETILAYAHERGLANRVVSNGSLLPKPRIQRKLKFIDILDISLRSANDEEYARAARQGTYAEYLAGIRDIVERRRELGIGQVRLRLFRKPNMPEYLREVGVELPDLPANATHKEEVPVADGLSVMVEEQLVWPGNARRWNARWFGHCDEFKEGFSILANGDLTTCSWDWDGRNAFGNFVRDGGLVAVLTNPEATRIFESFERRRVPTRMCAECLGRSSATRCAAYQAAALLRLR